MSRPHGPRTLAIVASVLLVAVVLGSCEVSGGDAGSRSDALAPAAPSTTSPGRVPHTKSRGRPAPRTRPAALAGPPPGQLIFDKPVSANGIRGRVFRILYHSRTTRDLDVAVSGLVVLPYGAPPAGGWPVLAYGHPTGGSADQCAPSAHLARAPTAAWNAVLDRHIAVAATDYEGLGGPGRHPYLVGLSEARSMIDAVRAARQLSGARIGNRYIAWGNSQGGHAAVFTAAHARWAPELHLLGAVAVAPVSDLKVFFAQGALANPDSFALLLASGYSAAYPQADPRLFLRPEAVARLPEVDASCEFGAAFTDIRGGVKVRRAMDVPVWRKLLEANSPGGQRISAPILLLHGMDDHVIAPDETLSLAARLCATGDVVGARFVPGLDHGTILSGSLPYFLTWIEDRFARRPVASECPHPAAVRRRRLVPRS